jgi:hypothetical protein
MKKIILILIVLTFTLSLFSVIIYVPDDYSTIQAAVNAASTGDEIIVRDGTYAESITINTYGLMLHSENGSTNCTIDSPAWEEHCLEASMGVTLLEGFTFKNATNGALVFQQGISELKNCIFEDNEKNGAPSIGGSSITAWSSFDELSGCIFKNNIGAHTVVVNSDYPLGYNPTVNETIKNNLFLDNTNTASYPISGKDISIMNASNNYHGLIENNTFIGNSGGIHIVSILNVNANLNIRNSIFYNAGISNETYYPNNVIISYCSFTNVGYQNTYTWGDGNLTSTNPLLCEVVEYKGYLLEGSPCIDAGDPAMTDSDGTRRDMGCYPSIIDIKKCEGNHWNWVCSPRLNRANNEPVNAPPVFEQFLDWPFPFLKLLHIYPETNPVLVYDNTSGWTPTSYNIISSKAYKLDPQLTGDRYLPLSGSRLPANHQLTYSLAPYTYQWLGYWLPESQNIVDAFGDLWQYVEKVQSEDWYYNKCSIIRGGEQSTPVSWSTKNKTLVYGKGYLVWFKDQTIQNFHWTSSGTVEEPATRSVPENFIYSDKPAYEVIDVVNIDPSISEIGVFADGVCVGSVVVQDSSAQILVYSDNANRDPVPFTFEIVTGRELSIQIKDYQVLDLQTGEYIAKPIISGMQEYSLIMFSRDGDQEEDMPSITQLYNNYPNPFNPTTTISFSVTQNSNFVTLEIFNVKGQKVRTMFSGSAEEGKHTVTWHGDDENGNPVSSGIYFYKLKTGKQELSRKMLLLK